MAHSKFFFFVNFSFPWIPVEYYSSLQRVATEFKSEIFAYATTIWEIFSKGVKPPLQNVRVFFKYCRIKCVFVTGLYV